MSGPISDGNDPQLIDEAEYVCPSCGEVIVFPIDASAGPTQDFVEDCPVCCSPNHLIVQWQSDGTVHVGSDAE